VENTSHNSAAKRNKIYDGTKMIGEQKKRKSMIGMMRGKTKLGTKKMRSLRVLSTHTLEKEF